MPVKYNQETKAKAIRLVRGRSTLKWPHCTPLIWPHRGRSRWWCSTLIWPHRVEAAATRRVVAGRMGCPGGSLITSGVPALRVGPGWGRREWSCSRRFVLTGSATRCRSGRWARKYDVHRRTVRQAIASAVPPGRKAPERQAVVLDQGP